MAIIGISGKIQSGKDTIGLIIQYLIYLDRNIVNEHCKSFEYFKTASITNTLQSEWEIKKFAYKLKQIASLLTGISIELLENIDVKNSYLSEEWSKYIGCTIPETIVKELSKCHEPPITCQTCTWFNDDEIKMTIRELLQRIGTDCMREHLHHNTWVNALFVDYKIIDKDISKLIYPNWIITDVRFLNEALAIIDRQGILIRVTRPDKVESITKDTHHSETALDNYEFGYNIRNDGTIEELIEKVKEILIKEKII